MRRIVWLASATAVLLVIIAAVALLRDASPDQTAKPQVALPAKPPAATPDATLPSFDIVSVDKHGQAVIAGRALPGDHVTVRDGDKTIGEVTADQRGEWALVPDQPMAPGNRQLSLEATAPGGGTVRRSPDVVALSVTPPEAGSGGAGASTLAVLLPGDANRPVRMLQEPAGTHSGQALSLDTVEYGAGTRLTLTGHADPNARVNIYGGEQLLGTATADGDGKWSLVASRPTSNGSLELRLAELASDGGVAQHISAPFAPETTGSRSYIVVRGNSLWLIARQVYGNGAQYTAIYRANSTQIHNPDLIYPGQHFIVPKS